jgi:glycosyltransferase involved in cell wall biosynthesis
MESGSTSIELSVVMPCLNEAETVETCVRKALAFFARAGVTGEVLVGDNGSTDGSPGLAIAAGALAVEVPERGYGSAIMGAVQAARGTYVIMGDADDSYDFSSLDAMLAELRGGNDLVMGNRFKGGIMPGAMPWLHRYLGNPVLSFVGRLFFGGTKLDFHCGLRGFRREAFFRWKLHTPGMEFASEMVVKALLANARIAEVPVVLYPDGRSRRPHLRTWRDGWRHLRFLLLLSPRWLFLYPGSLLFVVGLVAGALIVPRQQWIFDVHTLLYCSTAVIVGFNLMLFGALAQIFGNRMELLPSSGLLKVLHRHFTLELGVFAGLFLFLGGIAASLYAVSLWRSEGFGDIEPTTVLRIVIPATTAIMLGLQTVFASFLVSFSFLKVHEQPQ